LENKPLDYNPKTPGPRHWKMKKEDYVMMRLTTPLVTTGLEFVK
jgi:hypothetical protein